MKSKDSTTDGKYTIKIITDLSEFENLRDVWDQLAEKQGGRTPFLCFDWFKIWLKNFLDANQLMILLLYEEDRIVGIAPFLVIREKFKSIPVSKIELIGNAYSPIRGFLFAESDKREKTIYLHHILSFFLKDFCNWDIIDLCPLIEEDIISSLIRSFFIQNDHKYFEQTCYENYYMKDINFSGEDYLKLRSKTFRKELKKRKRLLEELGKVEFLVVKNSDELEKFINYYYDVYARSWKKEEHIGPTFHRDLSKLASENGWLRLGFIFLNDVPIATSFAVVFNGVGFLLKSAYDEKFKDFGLGTLIRTEIIKYIIDKDDIKQIDLGAGSESYKRFFAPEKREMKRIMIFNRTFKGNCLSIIDGKILPIIRRHRILNLIKTNLITKNVYK